MRVAAALLLTAAALALTAAPAAATPTVTVRGRAVPIPGFPHTGNIFGAGAAVHAEVTISGSEYASSPPPLIGITVDLPRGVKLNPKPFPTCPTKVIVEERNPKRCPRGSSAGRPGHASGVVSLGNERVGEGVEILSFYAPGGGVEFLAIGRSPVSLEVPATGRLLHPSGQGGFGPEFVGAIPLVETLPGAPDASVEHIDITLGTALRRHGKPVYYGTVPRRCPHGGFRARASFTFAREGNPATPETVTVPIIAPCPTH